MGRRTAASVAGVVVVVVVVGDTPQSVSGLLQAAVGLQLVPVIVTSGSEVAGVPT